MNDSQILSYIFYNLDHCGLISEARANALAEWIKRCREEAELQDSMSACTKVAEGLYKVSRGEREDKAREIVREIVRDEIYRLEVCKQPEPQIYDPFRRPYKTKWAHCKTYSYDMIDHSPEYEPEFLPRHWGSRGGERRIETDGDIKQSKN